MRARSASFVAVVASCVLTASPTQVWADVVVRWDFNSGAHGWQGNAYVTGLTWSRRGLSFQSTGVDPWIEGPAIDLPSDRLTKVTVRMKSDANSSGELFYGRSFRAGRSVRFTVIDDGRWHDYDLVILEMLGPGTRFRLDPATTAGYITVAYIQVETLVVWGDPPYEKPVRPRRSDPSVGAVTSGAVALEYVGTGLGEFTIDAAGREMAVGYGAELIGVLRDDRVQWLDLSDASVTVEGGVNPVTLDARLTDPDGATWSVRRNIEPGPVDGAIQVDMEIVVDSDREAVCLPWLTLFAGLGTFGSSKDQGLLAGLEYLCDEPSSSQADINTPEHVRRVPDPVKVTFPLMAIAARGRYVGLIWEPSEWVAPMFDSPDRVFDSGAHVMGLTGPAVGKRRFENRLVAHTPIQLNANTPITARAWIIGGLGETVVSAVQQYVGLRDLPPLPELDGGLVSAARLLAHGWVYSRIREGGLFRHAVWGEHFTPVPAPDASAFMDWLAAALGETDNVLVAELDNTRDLALGEVPAGRHLDGGVSHVRPPVAPLVFGDLEAYVDRRAAAAFTALGRFDADGVRRYAPGDVDYGKTHFADHANGYGAGNLVAILEAATLSADENLLASALELLDQQTLLYTGTVPRGAQTWEIPLHTPDILASGLLVKAYVLGCVISGREDYLAQARYWAWTGVPFVYLVNATGGQLGPYATIPVFGATNWQGSWFGRPVQWCGLVYASALHLLAQHDPQGPWSQIAKGITASGLQMTWPIEDVDRQGLLPDFVVLPSQHRDGPAINPGTVQAHVPELFDAGTLYDVTRLPQSGIFVHAPCGIHDIDEQHETVSFTVDGWGAARRHRSYHVLLSGWSGGRPYVTTRQINEEGDAESAFSPLLEAPAVNPRLLVIPLAGPAEVRIHASARR